MRAWPISGRCSRAWSSRPLPAADGRLLGADSLLTGIIAALYSQESWPYLSAALNDVLQGDPEIAFQLADFYYNRENGTYLDNSTEAFRAYNCMDYPLDVTDEAKAASEARIAAEAPTVAPYWSGPDACETWPYPPTGTRGEITADGAAPIVVVGTTNDPGDAVRVVGGAGRSAFLGRAHHARRRRTHRLQQGQRLRGLRGRGVSAAGDRARGRTSLRVERMPHPRAFAGASATL